MSDSKAADILGALLTSPVTLSKLAAEGKFASVPLGLPTDIKSVNWSILFEGSICALSILEIYAPGDETGWAVVYKPPVEGMQCGEIEVIHGRWTLERGRHDFSREPKSKSIFGLADALGGA